MFGVVVPPATVRENDNTIHHRQYRYGICQNRESETENRDENYFCEFFGLIVPIFLHRSSRTPSFLLLFTNNPPSPFRLALPRAMLYVLKPGGAAPGAAARDANTG